MDKSKWNSKKCSSNTRRKDKESREMKKITGKQKMNSQTSALNINNYIKYKRSKYND